jgi:hypothetical protein
MNGLLLERHIVGLVNKLRNRPSKFFFVPGPQLEGLFHRFRRAISSPSIVWALAGPVGEAKKRSEEWRIKS